MKSKVQPGIILLVLVFQLTACWFFWFYTVEDAYISFRYAENACNGNGIVYNIGEKVEGYTNFLWVILLAIFRKLFVFPDIAKILGTLFSLLLIVLLIFKDRDSGQSRYKGILTAILLIADPGFHVWSVAGLETALFSFLLVAALFLDQRQFPAKSAVTGIVFGLATLTRPEGALFFALYLLPKCIHFRKDKVEIIKYIIGFAVVVLPHELFRLVYYNGWVPNTFWVKSKRFRGGGLQYLIKYFPMTGFWMFPVAMAGLFVRKFHKDYLSCFLPVAGYLSYVYYIGGDWMALGRFIIPVLPFAAVCATDTLFAVRRPGLKRVVSFFLILNIATALVSIRFDLLRFRPSHYMDILKWEIPHYRDWKIVGQWFAQHADKSDVMSTGLGGIIPYYSGLTNIDRGGLNDKTIAQIIYSAESIQEEQRRIDEVILDRKPDFILNETDAFNILRNSPESLPPDPTWTMFTNARFRREYQRTTVKIHERYFSYYKRRQGF